MDATIKLLTFEHKLRAVENLHALNYLVVNELPKLLGVVCAFTLRTSALNSFRLTAASNVQVINRSTALSHVLEKSFNQIMRSRSLTFGETKSNVINGSKNADLPGFFCWIPISDDLRAGEDLAGLLIFSDRMFGAEQQKLLAHIQSVLCTTYYALIGKRRRFQVQKSMKSFLGSMFIVLVCVLLYHIKIPLSVVAPFELVPKLPQQVYAKTTGQIDRVLVEAGDDVVAGQTLLQLQTDDLIYEVEKVNAVIEAKRTELELVTATGYRDRDARSKIDILNAELGLHEAELKLAKFHLENATLKADINGRVLIASTDELQGKPVTLGEPLLVVYAPGIVELQIEVATKDIIRIDPNKKIAIYFDTDPLVKWTGNIKHGELATFTSANGVLSYRVIATLDRRQGVTLPNVGTRGTARVYGPEVSILYQIFRKPIVAARRWF